LFLALLPGVPVICFGTEQGFTAQRAAMFAAGDDHGPDVRITYPTDPGWGAARQMDLQHVRVDTAGGVLRLAPP